MKKKIISAFVIASMIMALLVPAISASASSEFAGGSGSLADPYLISTEAHLRNMSKYLSANYKLINDIILTSYWTPIGASSSSKMFTGTLDGNFKSIKNLRTNGTTYQALFGYTNNASIVNLNIDNATSNSINASGSYSGSFVGYAKGTLYLTNCTSNAIIYGKSYVGGLVGYTQNALITNCTFTGVASGSSNVGGIVGKAAKSSSTAITVVSNSRVILPNGVSASTPRVSGTTSVGGIVGNLTGKVEQCYTGIKVSGNSKVGGIAGELTYSSSTRGEVYDCYSTGEVYASTSGSAGGIAGDTTGTSSANNIVSRCYSTSVVHAAKGQNTGGIVGNNGSTSTCSTVNKNIALNKSITQTAKSTKDNYIGKVTGKANGGHSANYSLDTIPLYNGGSASTYRGHNGSSVSDATAQTQGFYQNTLGWDFSTVWVMDSNVSKYPILKKWYSNPATVDIYHALEFENDSYIVELGDSFDLSATMTLQTDAVKEWQYDKTCLSMEVSGNTATFTALEKTLGTTITVVTQKGATASITIIISKEAPLPTDIKYITLALEVGDSCYIGGVAYDGSAAEHIGYTWTSSNPDILSVTKNGKVTAHGLGIATVTMSKDAKTYSMDILVREKPVIDMEEIVFDMESIDLEYGDITTLDYTIYPEDTTNKSVVWESDNEDVVLIGEKNGRLSVIGSGTATVTVKCAYNDDIQATIVVNTTKPVTDVIIETPEITELKAGETIQLSAYAIPDDATDTEITWSCSPEGIVSIDENGLLTGLSAGTVNVYATADGVISLPVVIKVLSEFEEMSLAEFTRFSVEFEEEDRYYALGGMYSYVSEPENAAYIDLIGANNTKTNGVLIKANNWLDSSDENPKAWMAVVPTNGCTSFHVSFMTRSTNVSQMVTEFSLQYSTDGINWTNVKEYSITKDMETYTAEFSTGSAEQVYIRWICTSNYDSLGVMYNKNGANAMRNIYVTGIK